MVVKPKSHLRLNPLAAFTIVELMMALGVFALFLVAITPLIQKFTMGSSTSEIHTVLESECDKAMNHIQYRLIQNKRLFQNTPQDQAFANCVQLSIPVLTGTQLPIISSTGSITPSSSTFSPGSVGNALLFGGYDSTFDTTVIDKNGNSDSVRVDIYRFNAFYLGKTGGKAIGDKPTRNLIWWKSIQYADYNRISTATISDTPKSTGVVSNLYNAGIQYAWNSAVTFSTSAFYVLTATGAINLSSAPLILMDHSEQMIKPLMGMSGGSYTSGISANTSSSYYTGLTVPKFGVANADYPSGFEVVVVGAAGSRLVFIRLVWVAQGPFRGLRSGEQSRLIAVHDVW